MNNELADYLYELGQLKRVRRSGWWAAGVNDPESVAEHTFRTAAIAFVLAELEGADAEKAATLAVFHDTAETRVNDAHHVAKGYVDSEGVEEKVVRDQTSAMPQQLGRRIRALFDEYRDRQSLEARIAKDADELECLLQAREYEALGIVAAASWVRSCQSALHTESAKKLAEACSQVDPANWWCEARRLIDD